MMTLKKLQKSCLYLSFSFVVFCFSLNTQPSFSDEFGPVLTMETIDKWADETQSIRIEILEGKHWENYTWDFGQNLIPVFYEKLKELPTVPYEASDIEPIVRNKMYGGIKVHIQLKNRAFLAPITFFDGQVKTDNSPLTEDPNRLMEYWFYGLNTKLSVRKIVAESLPIYDFKMCAYTGNPVVNTSPKQCLMANKDIFLDVPEKATQESIQIKSFDECIIKGKALIDTFPRRCIAAGGHVFTEPPRVFTPPKPIRSKRYSTETLFDKDKPAQ